MKKHGFEEYEYEIGLTFEIRDINYSLSGESLASCVHVKLDIDPRVKNKLGDKHIGWQRSFKIRV